MYGAAGQEVARAKATHRASGRMNFPVEQSICPGCGVRLPAIDGPVHRYMHSTPACWHAFGRVLAREYEDREYFAVHHLTVDAYAVQHPGDAGPQAVQSVGVHLLRLHLLLERAYSPAQVLAITRDAVKDKGRFTRLPRPDFMGDVTVLDVVAARNAAEHRQAVQSWAHAAWQAWAHQHDAVRRSVADGLKTA
jgi:hypothetical protein